VDVVTTPLAEPLSKKLFGTSYAPLVDGLGLATVGDLVRYYPRRYDSWASLTALSELPMGEGVTIVADVRKVVRRAMKTRRGTMMVVTVTDGASDLDLTFFSDRGPQAKLATGRRGMFSGTVGIYQGKRQLTHPTLEFLDDADAEDAALAKIDKPIPVYPATGKITSSKIAACIGVQLDMLPILPDPLPAELRERLGFVGLGEALRKIHRPDEPDDYKAARRRLRFEEAFVLQVALARRRLADAARVATSRVPRPGGLLEAFDERLPFELTPGQQAVGEEIAADLAKASPMHRLLQGEVGSGKTVVALRAMLATVDAGGQAALLAPTEVLAAQHHRGITALLGDLAAGGMLGGDERGTRVALLTGSLPTSARKKAMLDAVSGDAGIVVGTHALIQDRVEFHDLGLVVVDEQHRFGVEQRDAMRGKGRTVPHLLVMTATPIPRTVAMTVFGDLETSTLAELPKGRSPITTHVVPAAERPGWYARAWTRLREEIDAGHQGYVVCPRIGDDAEDGERAAAGGDDGKRPMRGVLEVLEELRGTPALAGLRVEMLHGRLPADERDATMQAFARGEVDVLVATTVIEVGVDVPNATAMVVLDADRFGVSQLHQLRGRIGRGSAPGLCLLVTDLEEGASGRERLDAVAATLDGFELARVDLEQRREGDVLGSSQHGRTSLRLLRVLRDETVIEKARKEAVALVATDPDLAGHPDLAAEIAALLDEEKEAYLERG
jgi:ATP-dependent DNA helicase RecG